DPHSFVEDKVTPYPPLFGHMGPWTGGQSLMSRGYGPRVARCPGRQGFVVIYAHMTMLELETHCGCTRCTRQTTTAQSARPHLWKWPRVKLVPALWRSKGLR